MATSELSVGGGAFNKSSDLYIDEKDNNTGKIVVAVVLLLLALVAGTYAYVDMTQQKLDRASGEGAGYQVTLHDIFEPADAVNWKTTSVVNDKDGFPEPAGVLPKEVYVSAHNESQPALTRVRLFEYLGLGDDFPYTSVRFVTENDSHFINVDGRVDAATALGNLNNAANQAHIGKTAVAAADIYWLQTKLNQAPDGADYDTTTDGGWFLKSAGLGGTSTTAADNGQLGAYLQYRGFTGATQAAGPTAGLEPQDGASHATDLADADNVFEPSLGTDLESLVKNTAQGETADAQEMDIDDDDITVGSTIGYNQVDGPGTGNKLSESDADAEAIWHGYVPATSINSVSNEFRKYVQLNFGADVYTLTEYQASHSGEKGVWVLDDNNNDGWFYWIGDNASGLIENAEISDYLLNSIKLVEQPKKAFVYSQYVSMDARDCENIWTGLDTDLAAVLGCEGTTPAVTTLNHFTVEGGYVGAATVSYYTHTEAGGTVGVQTLAVTVMPDGTLEYDAALAPSIAGLTALKVGIC